MPEPKKPISGSGGRARERTIDAIVTEAVRGPETRIPKGRTGVSKVKSPKKPWREAINPHTGAYGEKAYGRPMSKKPLLGKQK